MASSCDPRVAQKAFKSFLKSKIEVFSKLRYQNNKKRAPGKQFLGALFEVDFLWDNGVFEWTSSIVVPPRKTHQFPHIKWHRIRSRNCPPYADTHHALPCHSISSGEPVMNYRAMISGAQHAPALFQTANNTSLSWSVHICAGAPPVQLNHCCTMQFQFMLS